MRQKSQNLSGSTKKRAQPKPHPFPDCCLTLLDKAQRTMLLKSGDCSSALNCASVEEKRTMSFPASEPTEVSASACFSASSAVILRSATAAVISEAMVAAENESPVEMVRSNLTPCWKFIVYQEACKRFLTVSKSMTEPAVSPSTCFIMVCVPLVSRMLH